jgi:hypothetical protein
MDSSRQRGSHWLGTASVIAMLPLAAFVGCDRDPSAKTPTAVTAPTSTANRTPPSAARARAIRWLAQQDMREGVLPDGCIASIGTAHVPSTAGTDRRAVELAINAARLDAASRAAMALGHTESTVSGPESTAIVRETRKVEAEGIETIHVAEVAARGGGTDVAVIVRFTPPGQRNAPPTADAATGTNAEAWARTVTVDELLNLHGARRMRSASGATCIVGFGQSTASGDRGTAQTALMRAQMEAMAAARRFAGEQLSTKESVDVTPRADGSMCTERTATSTSPAMIMHDMVMIRKWQHASGTGQTTVGVVVMVPDSGAQQLPAAGDRRGSR